jgi:hypothetical protein
VTQLVTPRDVMAAAAVQEHMNAVLAIEGAELLWGGKPLSTFSRCTHSHRQPHVPIHTRFYLVSTHVHAS